MNEELKKGGRFVDPDNSYKVFAYSYYNWEREYGTYYFLFEIYTGEIKRIYPSSSETVEHEIKKQGFVPYSEYEF